MNKKGERKRESGMEGKRERRREVELSLGRWEKSERQGQGNKKARSSEETNITV